MSDIKFNSCHDCKNDAGYTCDFYHTLSGEARKRQEKDGLYTCPAWCIKDSMDLMVQLPKYEFDKLAALAEFIKDLNTLDLATWSKEQIVNKGLHELGISDTNFFEVVPSSRDKMQDVMIAIFDLLYPEWREKTEYDLRITTVVEDIKDLQDHVDNA